MIRLEAVNVSFPVFYNDALRSLRGYISTRAQGRSSVESSGIIHVNALQNISMTVERGERVGIIGLNGAGKTTLLKTIAGIYAPTSGSLTVKGESRGFFNISAGLDPNASGLRNIHNMSFYYTRNIDEIKEKIPEIIAFTELDEFIYMPVHTYSSGMLARLMVSVAIHYEAENLLFDEALGAGDASFHEKLNKRVLKMVEDAKCFVLATHSFVLMRQYCTKALLLNKGKMECYGNIDEVIERYIVLNKASA
jgi:ABC-type polysaccharide/polyol phosphate transport system ATPase subunit